MGHQVKKTKNMVHINVRDEIVHECHERPCSPPPGYGYDGQPLAPAVHVSGQPMSTSQMIIGGIVLAVVVGVVIALACCGVFKGGSGSSSSGTTYYSGSSSYGTPPSRQPYGKTYSSSTVTGETDIHVGPTYGDTTTTIQADGPKTVIGGGKVHIPGRGWVDQTHTAHNRLTTTVTTRRRLEACKLAQAEC